MLLLVTEAHSNTTPTKKEVYNYLLCIGIKHPEIVFSQSVFETMHYKCKKCSLDMNNLFGFQVKKQEYLEFDSWQSSCDYYKTWQDKYYKGGDYYKFLEKIKYAKAGSTYIVKLKQIKAGTNFKKLKE